MAKSEEAFDWLCGEFGQGIAEDFLMDAWVAGFKLVPLDAEDLALIEADKALG